MQFYLFKIKSTSQNTKRSEYFLKPLYLERQKLVVIIPVSLHLSHTCTSKSKLCLIYILLAMYCLSSTICSVLYTYIIYLV